MNETCIFCQRQINYQINLGWLFSFSPLVEKWICQECYSLLSPLSKTQTCKGCGRKSAVRLCQDCQKWKAKRKKLLYNKALYVYQNDLMKAYFERYKFLGDYYLRKVFQREFEHFIYRNFPAKEWQYVPIPVSKQTFAVRKFNQVTGLVEHLPLKQYLSVKSETKEIQSHKNRFERLNTTQLFSCDAKLNLQLSKILLIDDIYTTGTTLYHAQKLMQQAGAQEIRSVTLAR